MRNYLFFLKKELKEGVKTYKLPILGCIFVIFGVLSPMTAKFLPLLLPSLLGNAQKLELPEPSSIDSWTQYFKNINQLGFIVLLLLFSGILSNEIERGTLINLLTKGLSRTTVILAKLTSMIICWTVSLFLSFLITWGYTVYYFSDGKSPYLVSGLVAMWVFGCLLLSVLLFSATLIEKSYGSLLITTLFVGIGLFFSIIERIAKYNPFSLVQKNIVFVQGKEQLIDYTPAILICLFGILLLVSGACKLFKQKIL